MIKNLLVKAVYNILFEIYFPPYYRYARIPDIYNIDRFTDEQKEFFIKQHDKYLDRLLNLNEWRDRHLK